MKRFYFLSFILLLSLYSYGQSGFQNSYGDTTADFGRAICKSSTGMYCIAGSTYFNTTDSTEIAIYFINPIGDLILASTVGMPGNDYPTAIIEAPDGNFIITGYTYGSPLDPVFADIFAVKVSNVDAFALWSVFYGGQNEDRANTIINTPDGNYLIAGSTKSFGPFNQSALAMKIDDNGNLIWSKVTGIGIETEYTSAVISPDTNYILCGNEIDGNGRDQYITKMLSNGSVLWTNQIGSTSDEISTSIAVTADSGYIIGGSITDPNTSDEDQLLTKTDSAGNVIWSKSYSTIREERITGVLMNSQGNYIATGYCNTDTTGVNIHHLTLAEYDTSGNILWSNTYGNTADVSEGFAVIPSIDEGYACTGNTYGTGDPNGEVYLLKTDTSGLSGCDELPISFNTNSITMNLITAGFEDVITPDSSSTLMNSNSFTNQYVQMCFWDNVSQSAAAAGINLYPNPASDKITIEGEFSGSTFTIYDRLGKTIESFVSDGNKIFLNTSSYSAGIYLVRITSGALSKTLKFIRQ